MSLALDFDGVFKCGMSVAPVTDWALYGKKLQIWVNWKHGNHIAPQNLHLIRHLKYYSQISANAYDFLTEIGTWPWFF